MVAHPGDAGSNPVVRSPNFDIETASVYIADHDSAVKELVFTKKKTQREKFEEAARSRETNDSEANFDDMVKRIAESPKSNTDTQSKKVPGCDG